MNSVDLNQFRQTKTLTEKIYEIFKKKFLSFDTGRPVGGPRTWRVQEHKALQCDRWKDYLNSLDKIEYIYKFSSITDTSEHLLDLINKEPFNRIIIWDPAMASKEIWADTRENYIIIDRDFANVVLALGELP